MASERQCAANRANAKKSTGPKSRGGKMRASRNAVRHGLTAGPPNDADWLARLDKLAREIADSTGISFAHACLIAHAELEAQRACEAMSILSAELYVDDASSKVWYVATASPPLPDDNICCKALRTLKKLERYLVRAQNRRDRAVYACCGATGN